MVRPNATLIPKTNSWVKAELYKHIQKLDSPTKMRNLLATTVVYLKSTNASKKRIDSWSDRMYDAVKDVRKGLRENGGRRSEKQRALWLTQDELKGFYEERTAEAKQLLRKRHLSERNARIVRDALILGIHANPERGPPRNDWATATLVEKPGDLENHDTRVWKTKTHWYVGIYGKTKRATGLSKQPLRNPFSSMLSKFIKKRGLVYGDRIFRTNRDKVFTNATWGTHVRKLMKRRFGKAVGTSMLRMIWISNKYKDLPKILREYEADAKAMLHSSDTSRTHYLKQ